MVSAIDGANKKYKFSIKVSPCLTVLPQTCVTHRFLTAPLSIGLVSNKGNLKLILVDLIEEDFTSRAFDNIKALHALTKELL